MTDFVRIEEVAVLLNRSVSGIRKLIRAGRFPGPSVRVRGVALWPVEQVDAWRRANPEPA
jgi:excisionase family DNA binding protein